MNLATTLVFAAEGAPPDSLPAQLATPIGIVVFLGSTYLLLRSNLGTRRAYLLLATVFFAFMAVMSLFWGYGAPGTPPATGPTNLPGQAGDALQARWVPFAADSTIAQDPAYSQAVQTVPEGWGDPEEVGDPTFVDQEVDAGVDDIQNLFSSEVGGQRVDDTAPAAEVLYTTAGNGNPMLAVTFQEADEETGEIDPEGETFQAFAYFDDGAPLLPAQLFLGISLIGFLLHAWLLDRDERMARRDLEGSDADEVEAEKVPEPA